MLRSFIETNGAAPRGVANEPLCLCAPSRLPLIYDYYFHCYYCCCCCCCYYFCHSAYVILTAATTISLPLLLLLLLLLLHSDIRLGAGFLWIASGGLHSRAQVPQLPGINSPIACSRGQGEQAGTRPPIDRFGLSSL